MAKKAILACDAYGRPATQTMTLLIAERRLSQDYCPTQLAELTNGARHPHRTRSVSGWEKQGQVR